MVSLTMVSLAIGIKNVKTLAIDTNERPMFEGTINRSFVDTTARPCSRMGVNHEISCRQGLRFSDSRHGS